MSNIYITETEIAALTHLAVSGQAIYKTLPQIRTYLKKKLGEDHARFFADPVPDEGAGIIEWRTSGESAPIPLSSLGGEELEKARQKLARIHDDIQAAADELAQKGDPTSRVVAENLRKALEIPGEDYVYLVDGRPVLAAWGHLKSGDAAEEGILRRLVDVKPDPVRQSEAPSDHTSPRGSLDDALSGSSEASSATEALREHSSAGKASAAFSGDSQWSSGTTTQDGQTQWILRRSRHVASGPVIAAAMADDKWRWLRWLLWALFFLLLFIIFWLLLRACAIGFPGLTARLSWASYCDTSVIPEGPVDATAGLRARLHELELQLAEARGRCQTAALSPPPEPEQPAEAPDDENCRRLCRDRSEHDASSLIGKMNVLMKWEGRDDLDIRLFCPGGGKAGFSGGQCGDKYALDVNYHVIKDEPIEDVIWDTTPPPPGTYRVEVRRFLDRKPFSRTTPFIIDVLINGRKIKSFRGAVGLNNKKWEHQFNFTVPSQGTNTNDNLPAGCNCAAYE